MFTKLVYLKLLSNGVKKHFLNVTDTACNATVFAIRDREI